MLFQVSLFFFLSLMCDKNVAHGFKKCPSNETLNNPQLAELLSILEFDASGCLCAPNATTGLYGDKTIFSSVANFEYKLTTMTSDVYSIFTALEDSFGRAILVHLFPAKCSDRETSSVDGLSGLSVLGTNADYQTCEEATQRASSTSFLRTTALNRTVGRSTCYHVNASITVYYDGQPSALEMQEMNSLLNDIIMDHMEDGDFNDAHADIRNITTITLIEEEDNGEPPWYKSMTFYVSLVTVILICCCCCCILAINLFGKRYVGGPAGAGMKDKLRSTFKTKKAPSKKLSSKKLSKNSSGDKTRDLEISDASDSESANESDSESDDESDNESSDGSAGSNSDYSYDSDAS